MAVLALAALSLISLVRGVGEILFSFHGRGLAAGPGSAAAAVQWFFQAFFLYFLAVAFCALLLAEPPVPQWMVVRNLFQFRNKVLTIVSVILPLAFLGKVMKAGASGPGLLFSGGGVFLVLAGIFLLTRFGSPAGDEGMAREGNRTPDRGGRKDRKTSHSGGRDTRRDRSWQEKPRESTSQRTEGDSEASSEFRKDGNVTVKPGPRRPRPRR